MFNRLKLKASSTNRIVCLLIAFMFVLAVAPVRAYGSSPTFTNAMRDRFVNQILEFGQKDYPYTFFALHDFDGDGIPELLMGRNNRDHDPLFIYFAVWRFDVIGNRFVHVGNIEESRYIMRDKFSNALITIYMDPTGLTDTRAYFIYHMAQNRIERNTVMTWLTTPGVSQHLVYDTMFIRNGFFRNDIAVTQSTFLEHELAMRGSFEEVMVHDWRGFNRETVHVAVYSWRPQVISARPVLFSSADRFTRVWQMPMYELIMARRGPATTLIPDEYHWNFGLWNYFGQKEYLRFALHDFDGNGVPELLLGWRYRDHFGWDVYRWWNNEMRFIGSFESYAQYLAIAGNNPRSGDVFTFDPVPNEFFRRTVRRISFRDNMLQSEILLASYQNRAGAISFLEGSRYTLTTDVPNPRRANLVTITNAAFTAQLTNYVTHYREIRTFDIEIVPPSAVLIMYLKTNAFTR